MAQLDLFADLPNAPPPPPGRLEKSFLRREARLKALMHPSDPALSGLALYLFVRRGELAAINNTLTTSKAARNYVARLERAGLLRRYRGGPFCMTYWTATRGR